MGTRDINSLSEQELASLPGVGQALARKAVTLRDAQGQFGSLEEFAEAIGIKPQAVSRLRGLVSASRK